MRCIVSFEVKLEAETKGEAAQKAQKRLKAWLLQEEDMERGDVHVWIEYRPMVVCPDCSVQKRLH